MNTINYEKPMLKFVSIRNESKVAATCWGHHSSGKTLFCDTPGIGYMSFQISNGSCDLNVINVVYYDEYSDYQNGTGVAASGAQITALKSYLASSGGSTGQNFTGEKEIIAPRPDPEWS